jgi:hypothetical protein
VTWLPVKVAESPDYEAVFGLLPEQWANLREVYSCAWAMTDRELLELCRMRMAQTFDCPRPLGAGDDRLRELDEWSTSDGFSETERAALNYVDHYILDCNAVTAEMNDELERSLGSPRALYQFVTALNTVEMIVRACVLLDLDGLLPQGERSRVADPGPDDGEAPPPTDGVGLRRHYRALIDTRFWQARAIYGASVVRLADVDALTTECVRLRNATFQQCRY